MTLSVGTRLGPYEITAAIGAGGMGEVYRGRDATLNRDVAIKVLPAAMAAEPERLARFKREAQVLASLNHPNIAHVHGFEAATLPDGSTAHFLAMEMVEGEDLSERLKRGAIPVDEAIAIARQIAEGLEEAHEHGIIHRDLKPANLKVTPDGKVKILDFGLAKALEGDPSTSAANSQLSHSPTMSRHMTEAGMIMGTAAYMSPEQARGKPVDRRADIWAFGVVLFEMLSGTRLFAGETVSDTLAAVLKTDPDWRQLPGETSVSVKRLLRRCLERDLRRRLAWIGDARLELDEAASPDQPLGSVKVKPARWVAAGVIAGAVATALTVWLWGGPVAPAPAPLKAHFDLTLPPAAQLPLATGGRFDVSPDGRSIVFAANSAGGTELWLGAIEAKGARPLPGTEGGALPFWSPDSTSVGFFANGKLKRIEIATGTVQTICESTENRGGGAWSRDGVIVFSPRLEGGLFRVPATGGAPAPLTTLDPSNFETNHVSPAFLPDSRHYVFKVNARDNGGLYIGDVDSKARNLLLPKEPGVDISAARYASGHLVYVRDQQLVARKFDPVKLAVTGEEFPLAEGGFRQGGPGFRPFAVSTNGVLVFQRQGEPAMIQLTWYSRDGSSGQTIGPQGSYQAFDLSPDGRTVVLVSARDQDRSPRSFTSYQSIWIMDVLRGTRTRFTSDTNSFGPRWAPQGDRVAFSSARDTPPNLYVRTLAGAETRLALVPQTVRLGSWAPRGTALIADFLDLHGSKDLWIFSVPGNEPPKPFLQTAFNEFDGAISPDGHSVAFISDESGANEVYVTTFPEPGRRVRVSTDGGKRVLWRDDGKELFLETKGRVMAASVATSTASAAGGPGAASTGLEVGVPRELFALPDGAYWVPAKGGQRFLVGVPATKAEPSPMEVILNWAPSAR